MNNVENVLRARTFDMFSDKWYVKTSEMIAKTGEVSKGCVYFLRDPNSSKIKIGKTSNLNKRMETYRTYSSSGIFLCGIIFSEDMHKLEKEMHIKFSNNQIKGEWFYLNESQVNDAILNNGGQVVNKIWNREAYELDGMLFNLEKNKSKFTDSEYYDKIFSFLKTLKLNKYYHKNKIYDKSIAIDDKYKPISKKRFHSILKGFCEVNNYFFETQNTNGSRKFAFLK